MEEKRRKLELDKRQAAQEKKKMQKEIDKQLREQEQQRLEEAKRIAEEQKMFARNEAQKEAQKRSFTRRSSLLIADLTERTSMVRGMWERISISHNHGFHDASSNTVEDDVRQRVMTGKRTKASTWEKVVCGGESREDEGIECRKELQTSQSHSYGGPAELEILFQLVNRELYFLPEISSYLPLSSDNIPKTFEDLKDGVVACYYLHKMCPNSISAAVIRRNTTETRVKLIHWKLCLTSARAAGCHGLNHIQAEETILGDPQSILTVLWEISRVGLELKVKSLTDALEDLEMTVTTPISDILTGWVSLLIQGKVATDISNDFKDSFFYLYLCNELLGTSLDILNSSDYRERAVEVVNNLQLLGLGSLITPDTIVNGTYWANYILLCQLFLHTNSD
eukprot:TRINITY_DN3870_c0_g5_i1.p1 TRINITY_DN3870_c0_g5~~TRINITY_DN3870_c0_g5_i1.p1  ORF type:complete len:395 (+),score=97.56 TRINITY_DN3870_c0_g5_i1:223-1407(+)